MKAADQAYLLEGPSDDDEKWGIFSIDYVAIVLLSCNCFVSAIDTNWKASTNAAAESKVS